MAKRARSTDGRFLTGGTGDVKPQILTIEAGPTGVATDDYAVTSHNLPVPRVGAERDKATVFEILKIYFFNNVADSANIDSTDGMFITTSTARASGDTCTAATLEADAQDARTIAMLVNAAVTTTSGATVNRYPVEQDMTDGAGNGILVATDRIFVVGGNVGGTANGLYIAKILYRLVNVGIREYVGIVQSQQ